MMQRPHTARTHHAHAGGLRASAPRGGAGALPQRPLTARVVHPADVERGTTPRVRRLALAHDAAAAQQAIGTHRSSHSGGTPRARPDEAASAGGLHGPPLAKDAKHNARRHVRVLAGHGDHLERELAVNALCELLEGQFISRSWLVEQGDLVENLVALAQLGTPAQKDGAAVLLCRLAIGSAKLQEAIVRVPRTIQALVRLLRGSTDVQRVNAAATVWFLAENEEFRTAVASHGVMLELLVACIDQGTSPQSEHASGALRMLAFQNEQNALSTLQIEGLPGILLNAAKSESHGESLQAISLIAQLSCHESISLQFRSQFAALDDSLECLVRVLARDAQHREAIEMKVQAAICLRNLLIIPEVREMCPTIPDLVPVSIACFAASDGMLRIRMLGVLKTIAEDDEMRDTIVSFASI
jgi:hypothetical protein